MAFGRDKAEEALSWGYYAAGAVVGTVEAFCAAYKRLGSVVIAPAEDRCVDLLRGAALLAACAALQHRRAP
jgi:hypothetical protein